jgi:hypothetical protein
VIFISLFLSLRQGRGYPRRSIDKDASPTTDVTSPGRRGIAPEVPSADGYASIVGDRTITCFDRETQER